MEQQARTLRSVLDRLDRQEAVGEEAPNSLAEEFARLKSQSTKYRTDKTYPTKTAERQDNVKKNRYKDIVPFDHSRVKLALSTNKNDTDYINASFIKGVSGSRAYIATQGPLPHTVLDFLRMLWEYDIKVVVMACREFEYGKKKSERYWPQKEDQPFICEPFTVYCDSEESKGDYLTRMLRVTYQKCSRTLMQLHYVNWPDHGVPDSIPPILEMLHDMRSYQAHDDIPICIHCSAGCGRTGALCAIDYTWNLLKKQMITLDFNIYDLVQNMRTQRPSVVQTKEQYELVYRTIKLLFQRYLQSVDTHACRNKVLAAPPAVLPHAECDPLDLSEELDLLPQLHHLLDKERKALAQCYTPLPPTSENLTDLRAADKQMDQQQWGPLRAFPDTVVTSQYLQERPRTSPKQVHTSQRAPAIQQSVQENDDLPSLKPPPSPAVAGAVCLMVEDPYFDTPMSSPSSEEVPLDINEDAKQWAVSSIISTPSLLLNEQTLSSPVSGTVEAHTEGEAPPPLPERTPESYVLAVDTAHSDPRERLSVIIPPNAAAEAVRELGGSSPPSPVPPLPERTPESYELDTEQAPLKQTIEVMPAGNRNRIGMSSEWSGNSKPAASVSHSETKLWGRSKSMKAKMTFTAVGEKAGRSLQPVETTRPSSVLGVSSERDCNSHSRKFLDVVMSRSKNVPAQSSGQEPLVVVRQVAPPPVVAAGAGSAQVGRLDVHRPPSLVADTSENKPDRSNEKGPSRSKSLKFFKHKQKTKPSPAPPPDSAGSASSSVFRFGFGNRFGKPKGPRSYPESWF